MSDDQTCKYCFGTGQHVEMTPVRPHQPLPPYRRCTSCGGSGIAPKPAKVWRRKSMRRIKS
jgi:DnaJ-class molecular chaperone